MLCRMIPIVCTSIKRCYSLSSKGNDNPTNSPPIRSSQEYLDSFDECKKTIEQIESEGPIDYACSDPIPLDWSSLPDEDFSHLDSFMNIEKSTQSHDLSGSSLNIAQDVGNDSRTKHFFSPGEFAILSIPESGHKRRPVVILSSSFHNRFNGARVLVVPVSSVINNTVLHRMFITANNTRQGRIVKNESNLLFDYTSMVFPKHLQQTKDRLQDDAFKNVLDWWHHCVKSVISNT